MSREIVLATLARLAADLGSVGAQAPEKGPEALLFRAVQDIMENSAQSLRLTRLSGRRDMSTLLAQSAFSVQPPAWRQCCMPNS